MNKFSSKPHSKEGFDVTNKVIFVLTTKNK